MKTRLPFTSSLRLVVLRTTTLRSHICLPQNPTLVRTNVRPRPTKVDILEDLQKKTAAALKSTEELEVSSEEAQIERQLAIYDCGRNSQSVELLMELGKRGDGDEDGVLEFMNQMKFKADIIADAELFTSGMRDDKDTFLGLYYQNPEKVLEYKKHGFHFVNRLLEYHANLNEREISPEVKKEHVRFIRMLFLSNFSFKLGRAFLAKEGAYPYWKAVQSTMGW